MAFNFEDLIKHQFADFTQDYSVRDAILYALGLGFGQEPENAAQLRFVYEKDFLVLPTMGVVLAHPGFWAGIPELGIDWVKMLHVGQGLTMHHALPQAGSVIGRSRITDVIDRGAEKGALMFFERDVIDGASGICLATVRQTLLCRGNGGFGGPAREVPPPATVPLRQADFVTDIRTAPNLALLYRLSGDMNPLHADPDVAIKAGFPRPILHGLATFGVAFHAMLREVLGYNPQRFQSFDVRFTAPVFPGETIRTEMWREGDEISLRSTVLERGKVVLDNGVCRLGSVSS